MNFVCFNKTTLKSNLGKVIGGTLVCNLMVCISAHSIASTEKHQNPTQVYVENRIANVLPANQNTQKIIKRVEIESEARKLAEQGLFSEAIQKYEESMQPKYLNRLNAIISWK